MANWRQGKGRVKAVIYLKYTKLRISFFSIKEERRSVQMGQVFDGESILKISSVLWQYFPENYRAPHARKALSA